MRTPSPGLTKGIFVSVDSVYSTSYVGANAVDGDNSSNSSRWLSANTSWAHWIEVDLQDNYAVSELGFWTGYDGYNNPPTDFRLQQWDGSNWVDVFSETGNTNASYSRLFAPVTTSKVWLYATAGVDNYFRLYEIQVYGCDIFEQEDFEMIALYWLEDECNYYDQCEGADREDDNQVGLSDLADLARVWLSPDCSGLYRVYGPYERTTETDCRRYSEIQNPTRQECVEIDLREWIVDDL